MRKDRQKRAHRRTASHLLLPAMLREREQQWQADYLASRYLEHRPPNELRRRLEDVLLNLLGFSNDGTMSFDSSQGEHAFLGKLVHIRTEMELRRMRLASNIHGALDRLRGRYPRILDAIRAWRDRKPPQDWYLVKYGKFGHIKELQEKGRIRINAASFFNRSFLPSAIRDTELKFLGYLPPGTKLKMQTASGEYEEIKGISNLSMAQRSQTDYYIYSMSALYQHRCFDDFKADACLLIHDPREFLMRIVGNLKRDLSDWLFAHGMVHYYDPFGIPPLGEIAFRKHFRYSYQREHRVVIKPKQPVGLLDSLDLELGDLSEFSEIVQLE